MAGEIQIGGTTFATESAGTVTVANVDSATNRTNLGLGSIATQNANAVALTGGSLTGTEIDLKSSGTTIYKSDGSTAVISESGATVTLNNATLGSAMIFPAGKIINIGYGSVADKNDQEQHFSSNSITFGTTSGIPALSSSSNKVFMIWSAQYEKRSGGTGAYFVTYATGGGLGSTTSGQQLTDGIFYVDPNNHRKLFTIPIYDVSPGSTTPTYSLYHNSTPNVSETWSISRNRIMTFEIQG